MQSDVSFASMFYRIKQLSKTRAGQRLPAGAGADKTTGDNDDKSGETGGGPSKSS